MEVVHAWIMSKFCIALLIGFICQERGETTILLKRITFSIKILDLRLNPVRSVSPKSKIILGYNILFDQ